MMMTESDRLPMNLVYFGSGEFGLPTLERLHEQEGNRVVLVVSQPDRPAGRKRRLQPTPVSDWALRHGIELIRPENVNDPDVVDRIHREGAGAFVVIAFGQKMGRDLLGETFAINLHASLLPKYRGAAPIQRAMMENEPETGVSVITLADRMDAGDVLAMKRTAVRSDETFGELHDRLAEMGPGLIVDVLGQFRSGTLHPVTQDESQATRAKKLTKPEGTIDFSGSCENVRARIHGLNPWPGCVVRLESDDQLLRIGRVCDRSDVNHDDEPGVVRGDLTIACGSGVIEVLEIQAPGGKMMPFAAFMRGHGLEVGGRFCVVAC